MVKTDEFADFLNPIFLSVRRKCIITLTYIIGLLYIIKCKTSS